MSARDRHGRLFLRLALLAPCVVAACHAFLDPDALVSGAGGGDEQADGGDGASQPAIEDASALFDGGADAATWEGEVPGCAPAPPPGAIVYAVPGGPPGTVSCPSGYEATPVQSGKGGVINGDHLCTANACSCAPIGAGAGCALRLRYYGDMGCNFPLGTEDINGNSCARVDILPARARLTRAVQSNGSPCNASGESGIVKQAASFGLEVHLCKPAGAPAHTCRPGQIPLPPTKDAVACYQTTGGCAAGYRVNADFSVDGTMNDTRSCSCRCHADGGASCSGGSVSVHPDNDCDDPSIGTISDESCRPTKDFGDGVRQATPPTLGSVVCSPEAEKSGRVSATPQLRLCCLAPCDSCRLAATSPGGVCAGFVDACNADPACVTLRDCIETRCNGFTCIQCTNPRVDAGTDGGDAGDASPPTQPVDPASVARFDAIQNCAATACTVDCN